MARRIEVWPVERLKPYERNARTHSDEQIQQLAASIAEFGFTNPVLVDASDGIIAGHGRLMAAKLLELTEVPVIVLDHLTLLQKRAYILADNKLALNAGWDEELLQKELAALTLSDFDTKLLGWSEDELLLILDPDNLTGGDDEEDDDPTNPYTDKTTTPDYEVTGEKPELSDIYDSEKAMRMIDDINASDATPDEKVFLIAAAYRHVVFNYQRIAEYYAHSEAEVQQLMEDSALVIVDIGDAIKNGWTRLGERLEAIYSSERDRSGDDAK
jgi:hypothetical protein